MPLLRLIALVAAVIVGIAVLLYMVTGQARWRRLAWRTVSVAAVAAGVVLLLLLAEHLLARP
ncbi:MAG: hypothetical protein R3357_07020 [Burkholderiales bacterium]|nr:hypothetical protein [Burkholderiales bacterium]